MNLPRDESGKALVKKVRIFGYEPLSQNGSHIRCRTRMGGQHSISIPAHKAIRLGTLKGIISSIGNHFGLTPDEVARRLFR